MLADLLTGSLDNLHKKHPTWSFKSFFKSIPVFICSLFPCCFLLDCCAIAVYGILPIFLVNLFVMAILPGGKDNPFFAPTTEVFRSTWILIAGSCLLGTLCVCNLLLAIMCLFSCCRKCFRIAKDCCKCAKKFLKETKKSQEISKNYVKMDPNMIATEPSKESTIDDLSTN